MSPFLLRREKRQSAHVLLREIMVDRIPKRTFLSINDFLPNTILTYWIYLWGPQITLLGLCGNKENRRLYPLVEMMVEGYCIFLYNGYNVVRSVSEKVTLRFNISIHGNHFYIRLKSCLFVRYIGMYLMNI